MLRRVVLVVVIAAALVPIYFVGITISRVGKHKITISVAPSSATIKVDGKETGSEVYVSPGVHKITASLDGFEDFSTTTKADGSETISVLLVSNSKKGDTYLLKNKEAQYEVQLKGDEAATKVNNSTAKFSPLLSQLPADGIIYQINSGEPFNSKSTSSNAVALYVTSDNPQARKMALDWIKDTGVDPTDIEIVFQSVINPFVGGGE